MIIPFDNQQKLNEFTEDLLIKLSNREETSPMIDETNLTAEQAQRFQDFEETITNKIKEMTSNHPSQEDVFLETKTLKESLSGKTIDTLHSSEPNASAFTFVFTDGTYLDVSSDSEENGRSYIVLEIYGEPST